VSEEDGKVHYEVTTLYNVHNHEEVPEKVLDDYARWGIENLV